MAAVGISSLAVNLYRLSALLNAVCIPGHIKMGLDVVHPALNTIKPTGSSKIGARGAQNSWNYFNGALLVAAALNWQWARTGGPTTTEEKVILAAFSLFGGLSSIGYARVGEYPPLVCLFLAPTASVAAYLIG